jgi:diguanylate cyclase (GGDEF)-like protein
LSAGEPAAAPACEREPIHIPGAIQPHGLLLACEEPDLVVRMASANVPEHLGLAAAEEALGRPLREVVGPSAHRAVAQALAEPDLREANPMTVQVEGGTGRARELEAVVHRSDGLAVVELEPTEGLEPGLPPHRHLRETLARLRDTDHVDALCDLAAAEVRRLTGYARVMVYRFHPDLHGEVVAERREPELDPYLGLHYPATDIPRQARELYLRTWLRVIVDVGYKPVPLVPACAPGTGRPLDLSLATLRSVSPVHLQYLRNMGAAATMTISLVRDGQLWGMIACHHHRPKRISHDLRATCELVGQLFSLQLASAEQRRQARRRLELREVHGRLLATLASARGSLARAVTSGDALLALTQADGAVVRLNGELATSGRTPRPEVAAQLAERLAALTDNGPVATDHLSGTLPGTARLARSASGALLLPLGGPYRDFILWLRGERVQTVAWGGDPHKPMEGDPNAPPGSEGARRLGPRRSFAAWRETVRQRSRPWGDAEVEAAAELGKELLARTREQLAYLALHDPLTRLPNRALLVDRLERALERRAPGARVGLLFVDLDRFKLVNDTVGHTLGDRVLQEAARRLAGVVRAHDTVARFGGDEFVVLCEEVPGAEPMELLADRLVTAFHEPFTVDDEVFRLGVSVGVAVSNGDTDAERLVGAADTAMYQAKQAGRGRHVTFERAMRSAALQRVEIERGLHDALAQGLVRPHFQGVYSIDGQLVGFEALARWHANGTVIPPDEFIPVAEETGLIAALGDRILHDAAGVAATLRRHVAGRQLTTWVNTSPHELRDDLPDRVAHLLAHHGLPGSALGLEITETGVISAPTAADTLAAVRDIGVRVALDDFGTGYTSLAYLRDLPVDVLKIDRTFIRGLGREPADLTLVASIAQLAHELGLLALAEGIETPTQLREVQRLGCDLAQGFHLGRPAPAETVYALLDA